MNKRLFVTKLCFIIASAIFAQESAWNLESLPEKQLLEIIEENLHSIDSLIDIEKKDNAIPIAEMTLPLAVKLGTDYSYHEECLIKLGFLFSGKMSEKSKVFYEKAISILSAKYEENHPRFFIPFKGFGRTLFRLKQYDAALDYYFKARHICETNFGKTHPEYGRLLSHIGITYKRRGAYQKALPLYLDALKATENTVGKEHWYYGSILDNLGKLYDVLGDYDKALAAYLESNQIAQKNLNVRPVVYATSCNNLAQLYKKRGEYEKAIPYYEKALELTASSQPKGKADVRYVHRSGTFANLYRRMGKYEKARSVLADAEVSSDYESNSTSYYLREVIELNIELGEYRTALELALSMVKNIESKYGKKNVSYGQSLVTLARIYDCLGMTDKSAETWAALNEVNQNRIRQQFHQFSEREQTNWLGTLRNQSDNLMSFNFRKSDNALISGINYDLTILLKGLTLGNYNRMNEAFLSNSDNNELLDEYHEWKKLKHQLAEQYSLALYKRTDLFDSLEYRLNYLESSLARSSTEFKQIHEKISWKEIQETLKTDEVAVEFAHFQYYLPHHQFPTDSTFYVAYLLKKDFESPIMIPLFEDKELSKLNAVSGLYKNAPNTRYKNLNQLIWQPLEPYLNNISTIYLSSSGKLNRVNIGAVPINETETVANRFIVHQLNSTRQLVTSENLEETSPNSALLFGGINYQSINPGSEILADSEYDDTENWTASAQLGDAFHSLRGNDWHFLDMTETEVNEIGNLFENQNTNIQILKGQQASEDFVKQIGQAEKSPSVLHFATHGYFFPPSENTASDNEPGIKTSEHPMIRSGLIMAGANRVWKGGDPLPGKEDGILTAYEITELNLRNTELVVLSACNTGLGDIQANEGVFGLQRAFKKAGVKYILMTLWSVNDVDSYDFMTAFYKNWLTEKMTIPEAFRATQISMRERNLKPFNPRAWAGFVLLE